MTDGIRQIESRIQQIRSLVDPPAAPPVKLSPPSQNSSFLSPVDVSKEEFGTQLQEQLRQPHCANVDGITPLRKSLPPDVAAKMGISPREIQKSVSESGASTPITLPLASRVRQDVSAEAIRLDPDEAVRRAKYLPFIREASAQTGLPEVLIGAVIQAESSYKPETVSSAGQKGSCSSCPRTRSSLASAMSLIHGRTFSRARSTCVSTWIALAHWRKRWRRSTLVLQMSFGMEASLPFERHKTMFAGSPGCSARREHFRKPD